MQISDEEKFKKHTAGFESQTISPNVQSVYTANPFDNGGLKNDMSNMKNFYEAIVGNNYFSNPDQKFYYLIKLISCIESYSPDASSNTSMQVAGYNDSVSNFSKRLCGSNSDTNWNSNTFFYFSFYFFYK